jgi:predicted metal-dependent peptidase
MNKLDIALTSLSLTNPFLAAAAVRLEWRPCLDVPTLGVDGRTVYYNAEWLETQTVQQQMFCLAHEALHVMLGHLIMGKGWATTGIGPDDKPYNAKAMNVAMDYLINGSLLQEGFVAATFPRGRIYHNASYSLSTDLVALYKKLCQGSLGSDSFDTHMDHVGEPLMSQADIRQAALLHGATEGKSGLVERVLQIIAPLECSPWAALRDKVMRTGSPEVSSWRRPNRHLIARGVIAPSNVAQVSEPIGIVVDISGSCTEHVPEFLRHMASIALDSRTTQLAVVFTNHQVEQVDVYDDIGSFVDACQNMHIPIGGGTDMCKGLDYCTDKGYSRCVVLTDGATPFGSAPQDMDVIWAITTNVTPPYGDVVRI